MTAGVRAVNQNKAFPTIFGTLYFMLCTIVSAYFVEDIAFFNPNWWEHMVSLDHVLTFGVCFILYLGFFIFARTVFQIKFNFKILTWVGLLLACVAIGIFSFPESIQITSVEPEGIVTTYTLTEFDRWKYFCNGLIDCCFIYAAIGIMPKMLRGLKHTDWIAWFCLISALFSFLCSLFIDYNDYVRFFTATNLEGLDTSITSFYANKNVYGFLILMAFCASVYLHGRHHKWWHYLIMLFCIAYLALIACRTAMVAALISFVVYLFYRLIATWHIHRWVNALMCLIGVIIFSGLCLVLFGGLFSDNVAISYFVNEFKNSFTIRGISTMFARFDVFETTVMLLKTSQLSFLFGVGGSNLNYLLGCYYPTSLGFSQIPVFFTHNGFLQVFGKFGLVGLLIYLFFLFYLFFITLNLTRKKDLVGGSLFVMQIAWMVESLSENVDYFGATLKNTCGVILILVPLFTIQEDRKHYKVIAPVNGGVYPRSNLFLPHSIRLVLLASMFALSFFISSSKLGFLNRSYESIVTDPFSLFSIFLLCLIGPRFLMSMTREHAIARGGPFWAWVLFLVYIGCGAYCFFYKGFTTLALTVGVLFLAFLFSLFYEGSKGYMSRGGKYLLQIIPFIVMMLVNTFIMYWGYGQLVMTNNSMLTGVILVLAVDLFLTLAIFPKFFFPSWSVALGNLETRLRIKKGSYNSFDKIKERNIKKRDKKSLSRFVSE